MKPTKRTCAAMAALVVLSFTSGWASAGSTYYRWTDENGTTVNSDRPPPAGIEYETISGTTNFMYPETSEQNTPAPEEKPVASQKPEFAKSQTRLMLEKNPEYCAQAKKNLEALDTKARIRVPGGDGSYRYIDEDEKAEQRVTAEAIIAQHCK